MVAKACRFSTWPASSQMSASRSRARPRAVSCQMAKGSCVSGVCGTSSARVSSRSDEPCGSSANAACGSKLSVSTGGMPSSIAASTRRPGTAPGTKPWRSAACCTKPSVQLAPLARSSTANCASFSAANWSSSRARATTSSMSGNCAKPPMPSTKACTFCTNSEYSISFKAPLRLAICRPAWNSP